MIRRYGRLKVSTGRRLFNGMIRNNWKVCEYSDRDIAKFEAPLAIKPLGVKAANKRFIETVENFTPDAILMGHCDLLTNQTLKIIKQRFPSIPIIYRNIDPLWRERNVAMIEHRKEVVDAIFVSTAGEPLKQFATGKNVVGYIPNATDPGMDDQDNSQKDKFERDLLFVGRGNKSDDRYSFLEAISPELKDHLTFESYGLYGKPCIYGNGYDELLATSKMALNLNRYEGWPLYSSDRIAQLMGNGLLTFLWDKGDMRKFFTDEHVAFFKDKDDLVRKAKAFNSDDALRQSVAAAGRAHYHEHFSGQHVVSFMVETALGLPYSHDYIWKEAVFR
tara:strand:- start:524 stop:1522 length:999 start_codon:yes stop_codon:yes gene_type:complete